MTSIMNVYTDAFQVFFSGMNVDIINLYVIGVALATQLFFFSFPILLVKGR